MKEVLPTYGACVIPARVHQECVGNNGGGASARYSGAQSYSNEGDFYDGGHSSSAHYTAAADMPLGSELDTSSFDSQSNPFATLAAGSGQLVACARVCAWLCRGHSGCYALPTCGLLLVCTRG